MSNGNMDATKCNPLYNSESEILHGWSSSDDVNWEHDPKYPSIDYTDFS